jgi:hypothetical protein
MPTAIHHADEISLPAGVSVSQVKRACREVLNLPDHARSRVNGSPVHEEYRLGEADTLEFTAAQGRKGVGKVWTEAQFCEHFQITPEELQDWIDQGLKVLTTRNGSIRITETAANEFIRGKMIETPYFNSEEAAAFCHLTTKAFYNRVERKKIKPLPGSGKENLFTMEQLRAMMEGDRP